MSQIKEISAKSLFEDTKKCINTYESRELDSILFILLEDLFGIRKLQVLSAQHISWTSTQHELLETCIERLNNHEPVQYIVGKTHFYGRAFNVSSDVLIPRPETEELVDLIVNNNTLSAPRIVDIGTGSGCIAISLAAEIPGASVSAIDVSSEALSIAASNALLNNVRIDFSEIDFLSESSYIKGMFDIVISNPPYVLHSEKQYMHANVLVHEPHLALFVDDANALIYYDALLKFASDRLVPGGKVYAEINEQKGAELTQLAMDYGFSGIEILKDLSGKDRMLYAVRN